MGFRMVWWCSDPHAPDGAQPLFRVLFSSFALCYRVVFRPRYWCQIRLSHAFWEGKLAFAYRVVQCFALLRLPTVSNSGIAASPPPQACASPSSTEPTGESSPSSPFVLDCSYSGPPPPSPAAKQAHADSPLPCCLRRRAPDSGLMDEGGRSRVSRRPRRAAATSSPLYGRRAFTDRRGRFPREAWGQNGKRPLTPPSWVGSAGGTFVMSGTRS